MRVFDEIFNQGKFQMADEIYAPDFQNHGLHRSVDLKADQDAVHTEKKTPSALSPPDGLCEKRSAEPGAAAVPASREDQSEFE